MAAAWLSRHGSVRPAATSSHWSLRLPYGSSRAQSSDGLIKPAQAWGMGLRDSWDWSLMSFLLFEVHNWYLNLVSHPPDSVPKHTGELTIASDIKKKKKKKKKEAVSLFVACVSVYHTAQANSSLSHLGCSPTIFVILFTWESNGGREKRSASITKYLHGH